MRKRMGVAWLSGLALAGVCWAGERSLQDELQNLPAEAGISVAMFDHGELSTAPIGYYAKHNWKEVAIPGAVGHSFSYEGMLSPDGTLAAFPYWEVNPCPSWKTCDLEADHHYYLAIVPTDGGGVRKYPQIVLPSEMCWSRDNSKLAMVEQSDNDPHRQLLVFYLASGKADRVVDGKAVGVTPQCWSPDGKQMVYFAGDKESAGPGAIRIWDTVAQTSRDLFHGGPDCTGHIMCANPYPTWSPDGEWIAYFHEKAYWAIHPSGEGRKRLFRRSNALSPMHSGHPTCTTRSTRTAARCATHGGACARSGAFAFAASQTMPTSRSRGTVIRTCTFRVGRGFKRGPQSNQGWFGSRNHVR